MATAPVPGSHGGKLCPLFNEIAFNLVRGQFSQNPAVLLIVTLLSVPEFAFTLPLISDFSPSAARPVSGKMPEDYRRGNGGSRQIFQEHFVHEYLIACATNIGVSFPFAGSINAIR